MKSLIVIASGTTATVTSAAIDIKSLCGKLSFAVAASFTAGTTPAATYKITHCATSGGTYTDAATLDADGLDLIDSRDLNRYIKIVATVTGTPDATVIAGSVCGKVEEA